MVPPKIEINKKDPREVHFFVVSCMCDNEHKITLRRQEDGQYKVSAGIQALSNFQMKGDYETDLVWAAEDNEWNKVVDIINSGTSVVESVKFQ
jgi:hypothetical protein